MYENCFMLVLSCEKFKDRRLKQDLNGSIFPYKYFIGNPNLKEPIIKDDIVYLNCRDDYEFLIEKVQHAVRWVLNNYPNIEYILKVDDDVRFDFTKLASVFELITKKKIDYGGLVQNLRPHYSRFHFGKCTYQSYNDAIYLLNSCSYTAGPAYFVSKKSGLLMMTAKDFSTIYEDYEFGRLLNSNNIYPVSLDIKNNACFWE